MCLLAKGVFTVDELIVVGSWCLLHTNYCCLDFPQAFRHHFGCGFRMSRNSFSAFVITSHPGHPITFTNCDPSGHFFGLCIGHLHLHFILLFLILSCKILSFSSASVAQSMHIRLPCCLQNVVDFVNFLYTAVLLHIVHL